MHPEPAEYSAEASLVVAAQGGDMVAFEALYRQYFGAVYDFAVRTMKDSHSAADAVQDAFIKAHDKIGQLRDPEAFRPWLYAIVRREALGKFRSQARETFVPAIDSGDAGVNPLLSLVDDDPAADPNVAAELADSAALVWEAAASLDADTYTVLDLHVRQGLNSAEIAEVLGISKGNAYTKLNRMRERTGTAISTYLLIRKGSKYCDELSRIVAGFELPPVTETLRKRVDRHAKSCDECSKRRKALVAPMSIFAALAAVPPPAGLQEAIWGNVSGTGSAGSSRFTRRSLALLVMVGVFVLLLGIGAVVGSGYFRGGSTKAVALPTSTAERTADAPAPTVGSVDDAPVDTGAVAPIGVAADPGLNPVASPVPVATTTTGAPAEATTTTAPPPAPTATTVDTTVVTLPAPPPPDTTLPAPPPTDTTLATLPAPPPPPTPDTTPPSISQVNASPGEIWELDSNVISCAPDTSRKSIIRADVTDSGSGVATVKASWTLSGSTSTVSMSLVAGSYTTDFGPFQAGTVVDNTNPSVTISIVAVDVEGNTSNASVAVTVNSIAKCFG